MATPAEVTNTSAAAHSFTNLDIRLSHLEGDEYLVQGSSIELGDTEPIPTTIPADLATIIEKMPHLPQQEMVSYGQHLFNLLFREPVVALLYQLQSQVESGSFTGIRIRLRIRKAPQLHTIPWEYLHNGRSFLTLDPAISLLRYIPTNRSPEPLLRLGKLNVLLVIATAPNQPAIDSSQIIEQILHATAQMRESNRLQIDVVELVSTDALSNFRKNFRQTDRHILHIISHLTTLSDGQPALVLPDSTLQAEELTALLRDSQIQNILLQTPDPNCQNLSIFAAELIQNGLPTATALPAALPERQQQSFLQNYYGALVDGESLDTAVSSLRRALNQTTPDTIYFGIPQLYTSTSDTILWTQQTDDTTLDEDPSFEKIAISEDDFPTNIAQQTPIQQSPIEQRPLTKGSYDNIDPLPNVIDAPPTDTYNPASEYNAELVNPVTIPDGTRMKPGEPFTKIWRVRNTGTYNWTNGEIQIVHKNGDALAPKLSYDVAQEEASPNEVIATPGRSLEITLDMAAPDEPGEYKAEWQLQYDGQWFGDTLPVAITVTELPSQEASDEPVYIGSLRVLNLLLRANQFKQAFTYAQTITDFSERQDALAMIIEAMNKAELGPDDPPLNDVIEVLSRDGRGVSAMAIDESDPFLDDPTDIDTPDTTASEPTLTSNFSPPTNLPTDTETSDTPTPDPETREPQIWLYQADGSDESQTQLLTSSIDPLIWGANPNTQPGDTILIYRTSPHQDFYAICRAAADPLPAAEAKLPSGWDESWLYAIDLTAKVVLQHPLPRQIAHSHPDLADWNLMRTPQGSMRHTSDLRGYADGNWPALQTLILAWNPTQWNDLRPFLPHTPDTLPTDTFTTLQALPDTPAKWDAISRLLQTLPADHRLWQTAVSSDNLTLWRTALQARDQFPPTNTALLDKAQSLAFRQQPHSVLNLLTDTTLPWQNGTPDQQAQLYTFMAQAYEQLGQPAAAAKAWENAANQAPARPEPFIRLVNLADNSELDILHAKFNELAKDNESAAGPRAGLAAIARERQEDEAAREHIEAAVARVSDIFRSSLDSIRPINVTTAAPVPVISEESDPVLFRKQDRMRRFMQHHFTEKSHLVEIANPLGIAIANLHGDILNHQIISLINWAKLNGRLLDLEWIIIENYRNTYNPTATDWLDRVDICLHRNKPEDAITELNKWRSIWDNATTANPTIRARGYSLHGRSLEITKPPRPADAYPHWLEAATLLPTDTTAYEAIVRTVPDAKLEEAAAKLEHLKSQHPTAPGPRVGLAALAQRRAKSTANKDEIKKAADTMADELRTLDGSLVQKASARRIAEKITADPTAAANINLADLQTRTTTQPGSSDLSLTLQDLQSLANQPTEATTLLQTSDQRHIIEQFLHQTMALPTLSTGHKRELAQRGRFVLHELAQRGQLTPQLVTDLHLPILDALFIDKPAERRALLHAAAQYRAHPARRLLLLLRHNARRQLHKQLKAWTEQAKTTNPPDSAAAVAQLTAAGTITFPEIDPFTAVSLWQTAITPQRPLKTWQTADLTYTAYLDTALPAAIARQTTALGDDLWPAIDDLLFRQNGRFQTTTTWDRLQTTRLDPTLAQRLLHIAYPHIHTALTTDTAETALRRLTLTQLADQIDSRAITTFCQSLLQDDDLGLTSLDDAALFIQRIASGDITFTPAPLPKTETAVWPHLTAPVNLHPHAIPTNLTLPPDTFRKMASALNAGNHIILIGPPGTGKTTIAQDICQTAHDLGHSRGYISVTATADWTTFDTVGGYMPNATNQLEFNEGIILRAIREQKWLIIDEINRADIDKAFGELFTVLSGQSVTLPYRDGYHPIRILPANAIAQTPRDYIIPKTWRIIGTMNEYDKASLFQMSFAFMRRFAFVDVAIPDRDTFLWLIDRFWQRDNLPADHPILHSLKTNIFDNDSLVMNSRALGPAIAKDIISYLAQRYHQNRHLEADTDRITSDDLCEAFLMYAVPQFDGLEETRIDALFKTLSIFFDGTSTIANLRRRLRDLFPQYSTLFASETDIPALLDEWRTALNLLPPAADNDDNANETEANEDD